MKRFEDFGALSALPDPKYGFSQPKLSMGYGLWSGNPCKPTREIQKGMAYEGVWVIPGMC